MAFRVLVRQCTKELHNNGNERLVQLFSTSSAKLNPSQDIKTTEKEKREVSKFHGPLIDKQLPEVPITVSTIEDIGLVSGVPKEHIKTRYVRICQPPKNAMQSGTNNVHYWQIDFDTRERWENPLIGWASSGDPLSNVKVDFASKEAAIEHCEKMGWKYYIQKPNVVNPKPRTYGSNFAWNKRTRVSTK